MARPAVFLDRDGTVIEDVGYPKDPEQVRLIPGVADALHTLKKKGYLLVVISNQSGIGRGFITEDEAEAVTRRFLQVMEGQGLPVDGYYMCPHAPEDGCRCRKPEPGMLRDAAKDLDIDLERSFMVGDRLGDTKAGQNAGCKGILLPSHYKIDPKGPAPDCTAADWSAVLRYIEGIEKQAS